MARFGAARDPFWDMDGHGVRRDRKRERILGSIALAAAIGAVGLTLAVWVRELAPILGVAQLV